MNNKFFKVITCLVIIAVFTMSISTSYAKYYEKKDYTVAVSSTSFEKLVTSSNNGQAITLPETGYYAIILKGGDGADGLAQKNAKLADSFTIPGGSGGIIATVAKFNANTNLVPYIGNAAANISKIGSSTSGATNSAIGSGGNGTTFKIDSSFNWGKQVVEWLSSYFTADNAGVGGGAASALYVTSKSNSNLLSVAGGGGGSGSYDYDYRQPEGYSVLIYTVYTCPSGTGGEGGSNVIGTKTSPINTGNGSDNNTGAPAGYAFSGIDGNDISNTSSGGLSDGKYANTYVSIHSSGYDSNKPSYGKGGSTSGGAGGYVVSNSFESAGQASQGSNFANGGSGGNASQYGGGGGGGFCGGGGGNSASINISNGGGGGGSSYYAKNVPGTSNTVTSMPKSLFDELLAKAGFSINESTVTPTIITSIDRSYSWGFFKSATYKTNQGSSWTFYHVSKGTSVNKNGFAYIIYLGPDDQNTLNKINAYS